MSITHPHKYPQTLFGDKNQLNMSQSRPESWKAKFVIFSPCSKMNTTEFNFITQLMPNNFWSKCPTKFYLSILEMATWSKAWHMTHTLTSGAIFTFKLLFKHVLSKKHPQNLVFFSYGPVNRIISNFANQGFPPTHSRFLKTHTKLGRYVRPQP